MLYEPLLKMTINNDVKRYIIKIIRIFQADLFKEYSFAVGLLTNLFIFIGIILTFIL